MLIISLNLDSVPLFLLNSKLAYLGYGQYSLFLPGLSFSK